MEKFKKVLDVLVPIAGFISFLLGTYIYLVKGDVSNATYFMVFSGLLLQLSRT